ncbi:MAG: MAPEG family protein [Legionella sp.]|nr:MAPEG family protein [Legionella sp.]
MYPITTVTTSLLSIILIIVSIKIIKLRREYKVSLGDNGHKDLERVIRAHGNFIEYTPITLILMLCAEANQAHWVILFILALFFILGRALHAYAFIYNKTHFKFRVRGMILTFSVILFLAVLNISLILFKVRG